MKNEMKMAWLHTRLASLYVAVAVMKHFAIPVAKATAASIEATLALPHTIVTAVREYRASAAFEAELDAALIDHGFLDRAMMGVTPADEKKIADFMKAAK